MHGELNTRIGERMREIRFRQGITLTRLAQMLHRAKSAVSQYETGKAMITFGYVEEFARAVGVDPYQILRFQDLPDNTAMVEEWNHQKMVVLPEYFAVLFGLEEGSIVEVEATEGGLLIKPVPDTAANSVK